MVKTSSDITTRKDDKTFAKQLSIMAQGIKLRNYKEDYNDSCLARAVVLFSTVKNFVRSLGTQLILEIQKGA